MLISLSMGEMSRLPRSTSISLRRDKIMLLRNVKLLGFLLMRPTLLRIQKHKGISKRQIKRVPIALVVIAHIESISEQRNEDVLSGASVVVGVVIGLDVVVGLDVVGGADVVVVGLDVVVGADVVVVVHRKPSSHEPF